MEGNNGVTRLSEHEPFEITVDPGEWETFQEKELSLTFSDGITVTHRKPGQVTVSDRRSPNLRLVIEPGNERFHLVTPGGQSLTLAYDGSPRIRISTVD